MKKKRQYRSSYLEARWLELGKRPLIIRGYSKSGDFVCRLEINSAGVAIYSGERGGKQLGNHSWEGLVERLSGGAD